MLSLVSQRFSDEYSSVKIIYEHNVYLFIFACALSITFSLTLSKTLTRSISVSRLIKSAQICWKMSNLEKIFVDTIHCLSSFFVQGTLSRGYVSKEILSRLYSGFQMWNTPCPTFGCRTSKADFDAYNAMTTMPAHLHLWRWWQVFIFFRIWHAVVLFNMLKCL